MKLERGFRFSVRLSTFENILEMASVHVQHVCTRGLLVLFLKLRSILNAFGS